MYSTGRVDNKPQSTDGLIVWIYWNVRVNPMRLLSGVSHDTILVSVHTATVRPSQGGIIQIVRFTWGLVVRLRLCWTYVWITLVVNTYSSSRQLLEGCWPPENFPPHFPFPSSNPHLLISVCFGGWLAYDFPAVLVQPKRKGTNVNRILLVSIIWLYLKTFFKIFSIS